MFITKKHIPRRTFLRGAGAVVALPFLESMLPAQTPLRNTAANPKSRFAGIFNPHGAAPGWWEPKTEGTDFEYPFVWKPLEPFRNRVVIFTGLWSQSAEPPEGTTGSDHWVASAFMSALKPKKTAGPDIYNGTTIDQIIAQKIGQDTLLPSLEMGVEDPGANSSNCGEGYSCAYTNSISWPTPTRPNPMEINPQIVFERLFGDGGTPEERSALRERNRSILDSITHQVGHIKQDVIPADRIRIEQYLDDIREIERRLEIAARASSETPDADVPFGVPDSFDEHIKLQFDLNALAFQGDITRVSTLLYARDLTNRSYPESEAPRLSFHGGSHHQEDPRQIETYSKLNQYHVKTLAYFVEKLANTPDGDGTLLDHTLILYGSNMGNSNQHHHYDVPHILVGGASGQLQGGRHIAYPRREVPTGNLLLNVMDMFGIHMDKFGDSTGRLVNL